MESKKVLKAINGLESVKAARTCIVIDVDGYMLADIIKTELNEEDVPFYSTKVLNKVSEILLGVYKGEINNVALTNIFNVTVADAFTGVVKCEFPELEIDYSTILDYGMLDENLFYLIIGGQ